MRRFLTGDGIIAAATHLESSLLGVTDAGHLFSLIDLFLFFLPFVLV
jgi:hypothetical protein